MSDTTGTTISITMKMQTDGTEQSLQTVARSVEAVRAALNSTVAPAENLRTRLINYNEIARSFQNISSAVDTVSGIMDDLTAAYRVQEDVEARLARVMSNTMQATEEDVQAIKDLCSAQQQLGIIGDEVQLAGAQELATYLEMRSSLETLIPVMNDMVAQQYGFGASGENAAQIATMLGKVMQGQTGALSRYGYTFDEAQEKILKTGNEMERAAMLAQVVGESVGGTNAALAQTDSGRMQQLANAVGDVKEQLGAAVKNIQPYVAMTSQVLSSVNALAVLRNSIMALIPSLNSASTSTRILGMTFNTTTTAARIMATTIRAALIGTGIGAAIAALSWLMQQLTGSVDATAQAAAAASDRMRDMSDVSRQAMIRATEQRIKVEELVKVMEDESRSMKERNAAMKELNSTVDGFNARLDETGRKFVYNRQALEDYTEALQKMYLAEGAKELLTDLGRQKAENLIRQEEVKQRYEELRQGNMDNQPEATRQLVAAAGAATNHSQAETINRGLESMEQAELGALRLEQERIDSKMASVSKMLQDAQAATVSPVPPSGTDPGSSEREETRYEELQRLIRETTEQAEKFSEEEARTARANISAWQNELAQIELRRAALTRPETLGALRDYDAEINYQTALLATLRGEEAARTSERIRALREERGALHAVADSLPSQITTYEELSRAEQYYDRLLQTAGPRQRMMIEIVKKSLSDLRREWEEASRPFEKADTISDNLETAISDITSRIDTKEGTVSIRPVGLEEAAAQIKEITRLMEEFGSRMSESQRGALQEALAAYRKYGREAARSISTVSSAWSSAKSIGNGINAISDALTRQQNIWQRITGVIDGALTVIQGIRSVVQLINSLTAVTQTAAAATVASSAVETASAAEETGAYSALAAAKTFAAHASIPFAGTEIASGYISAQQAVLAAVSIPKFAEGGIVYGPTLALTGEYAGASSNPEVIAPLDRLRGLIAGQAGDGAGGIVKFEIDGHKLVGVIANTTRLGARSGRRSNIII